MSPPFAIVSLGYPPELVRAYLESARAAEPTDFVDVATEEELLVDFTGWLAEIAN